MLKPKALLILFLLLISITWLSSTGIWKRSITPSVPGISPAKPVIAAATMEKLRLKAPDALRYVREKKFNEHLSFLIDMSLPSGQNRFFIYDFGRDTVLSTGLVTHGRCNEDWLVGRKYGNVPGCGCTSLGKYKIGYSYKGRFGLAYKLYGLEKTNDKAFQRFVVLHSHECVPEAPVEDDICQSDGCPTVSPEFLKELKPVIDKSERPVMLWIFE